jgi:hypothetical protein
LKKSGLPSVTKFSGKCHRTERDFFKNRPLLLGKSGAPTAAKGVALKSRKKQGPWLNVKVPRRPMTTIQGVIHGKTIELERPPGLPDGEIVAVTIQRTKTSKPLLRRPRLVAMWLPLRVGF